jgi:hypothetical protein
VFPAACAGLAAAAGSAALALPAHPAKITPNTSATTDIPVKNLLFVISFTFADNTCPLDPPNTNLQPLTSQ